MLHERHTFFGMVCFNHTHIRYLRTRLLALLVQKYVFNASHQTHTTLGAPHQKRTSPGIVQFEHTHSRYPKTPLLALYTCRQITCEHDSANAGAHTFSGPWSLLERRHCVIGLQVSLLSLFLAGVACLVLVARLGCRPTRADTLVMQTIQLKLLNYPPYSSYP